MAYFYVYRADVSTCSCCPLNVMKKSERSNSFVSDFKKALYVELNLFGTPIKWHTRWYSPSIEHSNCNSAFQHALSFRTRDVFFDFECWNVPEALEFRKTGVAVANSLVFIAHISAVSIRHLALLQPSAGKDWVCYFLTELTIALYLFHSAQGSIAAIVPIISNSSGEDLFELLPGLCDECSAATRGHTVRILERMGFVLDEGPATAILESSVRDIVLLLLGPDERPRIPKVAVGIPALHLEALIGRSTQTIHIPKADSDASTSLAVDKVGAIVREALRSLFQELQWEIETHSATGAELMRWLDSKGLSDIKLPCAMAGVDSLYRLAQPQAMPLISWCHTSASGVVRGRSNIESLRNAVESLVRDPRAQPLRKRLTEYRDQQANGLVALMTPNAIETGMLSTQTQACALAMGIDLVLFGSFQLLFFLDADVRCVRVVTFHLLR